jgi:hypothetical protein
MIKYVWIALLAVIVSSCGQNMPAAESAPPAPAGQAPTAAPTTTPTAAPVAPTAAPIALDATATQARALLAAKLGIDSGTLTLKDVEPQQWPNSGLGCPDPNGAYTQVIVPGFLYIFSDGSKSYEVHTGSRGNRAVLCDQGRPVPLT